ncbi:hypothetical protein BQ8482_340212 [Mesorhizobium delmotii]|uniref:Uncharacterized protein n=1 Tax=Mesorhizobium delmotii TaxID=1631247 RepID=A0A2P9AQD1_9HYPH|nr:hypothetical protein BQ8482_340212 [Mesorhizobium delmotii]
MAIVGIAISEEVRMTGAEWEAG